MSGPLLVVDANVFVSVFAAEPEADRWLSKLQGWRWLSPKLARLECAIAFARKARLGAISKPQAATALATLDATPIAWAASDNSAIDRAFALSLEVGHELADCLYLALAIDTNSALATADAKLAAVASRRSVPVVAVMPA